MSDQVKIASSTSEGRAARTPSVVAMSNRVDMSLTSAKLLLQQLLDEKQVEEATSGSESLRCQKQFPEIVRKRCSCGGGSFTKFAPERDLITGLSPCSVGQSMLSE